MIRHAQAALLPVDPLPVPVIELAFRAVLVFPVDTPHRWRLIRRRHSSPQ